MEDFLTFFTGRRRPASTDQYPGAAGDPRWPVVRWGSGHGGTGAIHLRRFAPGFRLRHPVPGPGQSSGPTVGGGGQGGGSFPGGQPLIFSGGKAFKSAPRHSNPAGRTLSIISFHRFCPLEGRGAEAPAAGTGGAALLPGFPQAGGHHPSHPAHGVDDLVGGQDGRYAGQGHIGGGEGHRRPATLRYTQGTSTRPPTGSHTRPIRFISAMDTAAAACWGWPPASSTAAAAAMAAAAPTSA